MQGSGREGFWPSADNFNLTIDERLNDNYLNARGLCKAHPFDKNLLRLSMTMRLHLSFNEIIDIK